VVRLRLLQDSRYNGHTVLSARLQAGPTEQPPTFQKASHVNEEFLINECDPL